MNCFVYDDSCANVKHNEQVKKSIIPMIIDMIAKYCAILQYQTMFYGIGKDEYCVA